MNVSILATEPFVVNNKKNVHCKLHTNISMEIIIVLDGELKMNIATKDCLIKKNQGTFVLPFETHDFKTEFCSDILIILFTEKYIKTFF